MSLKEIGTGISATGAGSSVEMLTSPHIEGGRAELVVDCDAWNGTVKVQKSDDEGDTWEDVKTITESGSDRTIREQITLSRDMRYNCTAYTSGEVDIHVRAGD